MARPAPEAASWDPRSSASHNGFAKLSLMYQIAREAAEEVSDDRRFSVSQDAFEKALSVNLKRIILRTEAVLMQGRMGEFHPLCSFRVPWVYELILFLISNVTVVVY
jgi:hypothetical protein